MFYFIVLFVFNICVFVQPENVSYNATIHINGLYEGSTCVKEKMFIVKNNGSFNITFTHPKKITSFIKCCNNAESNPCDKKDVQCSNLESEIASDFRSNMTIIQVLKITKRISTRWICTFMKSDNVELKITFEVKVKNIEDKPTVDIGGKPRTPTIATVKEYDYIENYCYNDGELVDLDCHRSSDGKIRLRYLDSNGTKLIETDQIESEESKLTFKKTLTPDNNGDMIDCEYNKQYDSYIVQRTIFKFKNDQTEINNVCPETTEFNTKSIDKKHLKCKNNFHDEADIEFCLDQRELLLKGLPTNNVINEYNKNKSTWIIDYQYTIGEIVNLECVARNKKKKVRWFLADDKPKNLNLVLNDEHNEKTIICETEGDEIHRVLVILHKTVNNSDRTTKSVKATSHKYNMNHIFIPVASLLVVIVIGVMAACFCCWFKKTKLLRAAQNRYTNLPEPDLPIPPYPVQWDNILQRQTNSEEHMTDNVLYNSNAQIYANPQTKKHYKNTDFRNINRHKTKPIQNINNEEVAEYHYIESSATFNLKHDILKNIPEHPSPAYSNMNAQDDVIYVEPYAIRARLNTEENERNQAQSSNPKEGDYDYVYAGRYGNKMACGVNFNGGFI